MRSKNDKEDIIDDKADVVEVDLRGTEDGRNIDDLLDNKTKDKKTNAMYEFQTDKYVFKLHTGVNKRKLDELKSSKIHETGMTNKKMRNDPAKNLITPAGDGTISDSSSAHSQTPRQNLLELFHEEKHIRTQSVGKRISQLAETTGVDETKDDTKDDAQHSD